MQNQAAFSSDHSRFFKLLNDEQWCVSYLFSRRWPNGFTCACCKRRSTVKPTDRKFTCPVCGHTMSITSGTLFHGTKKHLSLWLLALWIICSSGKKVNCRTLQKKLAIRSYHTAWQWRQKIQAVIELSNDRKCRGIVEAESTVIEAPNPAEFPTYILAAKEIRTESDYTGRLRLDYSPALSTDAILRFAEKHIEKTSMVIVPDRPPYTFLEPGEFRFIPEPGTEYLSHTYSFLQQFLCDTQHPRIGSTLSLIRLSRQMTDFCFQANKKLFPDTTALFEHLVTIALRSRPLTTIAGSKQPIRRGGL